MLTITLSIETARAVREALLDSLNQPLIADAIRTLDRALPKALAEILTEEELAEAGGGCPPFFNM